jgi:hypothetical protein
MFKANIQISILIVILISACEAFGQTGKTVLDGVFTAAQATRGQANYDANCAKCHDDSAADIISIRQGQFVDRWREQSLAPLLTFMRTNMPKDNPGGFDERFYVDTLAYLLQENGFQEGQAELTAADVPNILLVGKDGPKPLPTGALVIAVGCLAPAAGGWNLTNVGSLVRTRVSDQTNADELKTSAKQAMGDQTLQLRNLELVEKFDPEAHKGTSCKLRVPTTSRPPACASMWVPRRCWLPPARES